MHANWKSVLLTVLKFSIPATIIGILLWRIEPQQWDTLSQQPKNYPLLAAALAVSLIAMGLSFTRWCILVRCQGIDLSMVEAFRLGSIGFLLSFVSAGSVGGDLFKAIFLAKRRPGKRVEAVASVFVDRAVGLYGLLLLVAITLVVSDPSGIKTVEASPSKSTEQWGSPDASVVNGDAMTNMIDISRITRATIVLVGTGTIVLAVLVFGGKSVDRLVQWAGGFPVIGGLVLKVGGTLRMFHTHPIAFLVSVVMSLCVHASLVISFYFVAKALYTTPPTLAEHFVIVPIALIVSALPLTPGGVGLLEVAVESLYRIVPAVKTKASGTLVALVFDMIKVVMSIIGTVFYWTANAEVRESLEIAEEESHGETSTV